MNYRAMLKRNHAHELGYHCNHIRYCTPPPPKPIGNLKHAPGGCGLRVYHSDNDYRSPNTEGSTHSLDYVTQRCCAAPPPTAPEAWCLLPAPAL